MKIHGAKREWSRPFWVRFKKHHCPACNALLTTIKVSKVVNSKSEEAKNFDFSSGDTCMVGNIKFIWTKFQCNVCNNSYSLQEIRENEKKTKQNLQYFWSFLPLLTLLLVALSHKRRPSLDGLLFFEPPYIIITTGRAGGMHQPPWGMPFAEPIGSSKSLPTAQISRAAPKGAFVYLPPCTG